MKVYIAVGANLGKKASTISKAIHLLGQNPRISIDQVSSLYRTQSVGGQKQPDYLNGVVAIKTNLSPSLLMKHLLNTEKHLGRVRRTKWGPRTIDLDLLVYGSGIINRPGLILPHPRYHQRRFVLVPFCEIAPQLIHPKLKVRNQTLLRKLTPVGQRVTMAAQWNGKQFIPSSLKRKAKHPS